MIVPTKISDIHYRTFLDLLDARHFGIVLFSKHQQDALNAVAKLTKGKVKVLGHYDAFHTEQAKMETRITRLLKNQDRVFHYIYALPDEDGYVLVVSKVKMSWIGRRTE